MRRLNCDTICLLLGSFSYATHAAAAAAYNSYQYDLTIPQFTPDGRLLQVEHASAAADHSSPMVVAQLNDDMVVLMATRHKSKVQERLVVLAESDAVVGISGIVADSLALLQTVQQASLQQRRTHGSPLVALQIARVVATACQQHAFGGGLRCYGSTLVVCGCQDASLVMLQSDPSGALLDLTRIDRRVTVVGGAAYQGGSMSSMIQRSLESAVSSWSHEEMSDKDVIARRLAQIVSILLQEHLKSGKVKTNDLLVEVAVVSKTRGTYKLTGDQVIKLMALA